MICRVVLCISSGFVLIIMSIHKQQDPEMAWSSKPIFASVSKQFHKQICPKMALELQAYLCINFYINSYATLSQNGLGAPSLFVYQFLYKFIHKSVPKWFWSSKPICVSISIYSGQICPQMALELQTYLCVYISNK